MLTIGRHRPRRSPRGDYETMCDYCGTGYLRSQLRRDRAGRLYCHDDRGRDAVTLSEGNAQAALGRERPVPPKDGGNWDHLDDPT